MQAPAEAAEPRDWAALPAGVLQHISRLASTWQTPGSCLAAPVCRTWRCAVAGCRNMRLLYHAGYPPADRSFAAWLEANSPQLEALTLVSSSSSSSGLILTALAEAAGAAEAAGRPLQLHTLRVLPEYVDVRTAGQLVACLPRLRCLQLNIHAPGGQMGATPHRRDSVQHLAALQRAPLLEELYLLGPGPSLNSIAGLLPVSLKRLGWDPGYRTPAQYMCCDVSHLTQLTFLQLVDWPWERFTSSYLPSGLQQLEVLGRNWSWEVIKEQRQLVTAWNTGPWCMEVAWNQLTSLSNLRAASVLVWHLYNPDAQRALQQLPQLSALTATFPSGNMHPASLMAAAAGMRSLRCLHLNYYYIYYPSVPPALDALTQLTQLRVSIRPGGQDSSYAQQQQQQLPPPPPPPLQRAWAEVVGRMAGLQWLSVPDVLLAAGPAWLGRLQRLRVLVLHWTGAIGREAASTDGMPWLDACSPQVLPPQLQVLGVSGMTAEQAATWQVRRRLRQALGSSGCEVVVGVDLDEVAGPTQQLAGLPVALQQALA